MLKLFKKVTRTFMARANAGLDAGHSNLFSLLQVIAFLLMIGRINSSLPISSVMVASGRYPKFQPASAFHPRHLAENMLII
jgi:hypothetical protein